MDRKRSPGMLTPLLLAGLVLLGSFSWAFLRTAAQGLKTQQLQQEARQWAVLAKSLAKIREEEAFFYPARGTEAAGNLLWSPVTGSVLHPGNEGTEKGSAPPGAAPASSRRRRTFDAGQPL